MTLNGPMDLFGARYRCKRCDKGFYAYDEDVLPLLPSLIAEQFPAVLGHKSAFSADLKRLVGKLLVTGMSMSGVADLINETTAEEWDRLHLLHLLKHEHAEIKRLEYVNSPMGQFLKNPPAPKAFVPFPSKTGRDVDYPGLVSYNSIGELFMTFFAGREDMVNALAQGITSPILKSDHTFAFATKLRSGSTQAFTALWTVMTGDGKVMAQYFTNTKSLTELRPFLEEIASRYRRLGTEPPSAWYTDICCRERASVQGVFPRIKVLQDIFHFLQRFKRACKARSPQVKPFLRALSKAIFTVDEDDLNGLQRDVDNAVRVRKTKFLGQTISAGVNVRNWPLNVLRQRCRTSVRSPDEILGNFNQVIEAFSGITDFWTEDLGKCTRTQREHVSKGCLTDPLPVDEMHSPHTGKAFRGTSISEGYHSVLNTCVQATCCSPDLVLALLSEFNLRFNTKVMKKEKQTSINLLHFDISLAKRLNDLNTCFGGAMPYENLYWNDIVDRNVHFGISGLPYHDIRAILSNAGYEFVQSTPTPSPVARDSLIDTEDEPFDESLLVDDDLLSDSGSSTSTPPAELEPASNLGQSFLAAIEEQMLSDDVFHEAFDQFEASIAHEAESIQDDEPAQELHSTHETRPVVAALLAPTQLPAPEAPTAKRSASVPAGRKAKRQRSSQVLAQHQDLPLGVQPVSTADERQLILHLYTIHGPNIPAIFRDYISICEEDELENNRSGILIIFLPRLILFRPQALFEDPAAHRRSCSQLSPARCAGHDGTEHRPNTDASCSKQSTLAPHCSCPCIDASNSTSFHHSCVRLGSYSAF